MYELCANCLVLIIVPMIEFSTHKISDFMISEEGMHIIFDFGKNKKNRLSMQSTYLRYLVSYILVLFLPLIIIGMFFYSYFFDLFENEVIKNNYSVLESAQTDLDTKINELSSLSFQILNNPRLTSYRMLNSPLDTKDGINDLKNYIIANNFIEDIYLYIPANKMIYSSTRTYTMAQFFNQHFVYRDFGIEEFDEFFNANKKNKLQYTIRSGETVFHDGNQEKNVTVLFPFIDRMVFFIIDEETLLGIKEPNGSVILTNFDQEIITAYYAESSLNKVTVPELNQVILESKSSVINLSNSDYFAAQITSDTTGWTYYSLLPVKYAMDKVIQVRQISMYGLGFILVLGMIAIVFVMRLNYNPIKKLKKFAETKYGHSTNNKNELEAVRLTINNFAKTSKDLTEKVKKSHSAVRQYLLLNLLKGVYINIDRFNSLGEDENLHFSHAFFTVAIVLLKSPVTLNRSMIRQHIETSAPQNIDGYGIEFLDKEKIIFIFSHSGADFEQLKNYLSSVRKSLSEDLTSTANVGIGNSYDSIGQIGKSYIEAATAIDYRMVKGNDSIILFEEAIPDNAFITSYPIKEIKSLETAILDADVDSIPVIVSSLINVIQENNLSLFNARCLSFDIISTVIKAMCTISKEFLNCEYNFPDVLALNEFENLYELGQVVENVSIDICNYIKENQKLHLQHFISDLISYIDMNYFDYNFSIQSMSYEFGMSPSNLGHYFKHHTGKSIMQYLNNLKIKKAKELLLTSEYTLNEIVIKLGYCDTSSFIRKFKKIVGTTPGIFRKTNGTSTI